MKTILFIINLLIYAGFSNLYAQDTCSRIATVNFQDVIVDPSSTAKGEGLRFYIEKDPTALEYLNEYQRDSAPKWQTAAISTAGTGLILMGILKNSTNDEHGLTSKNSLIFTGATFIALSYLISKTIIYKNEFTLQKSIDEYNKRNSPRIYFSPFLDVQSDENKMGVGIQKEF